MVAQHLSWLCSGGQPLTTASASLDVMVTSNPRCNVASPTHLLLCSLGLCTRRGGQAHHLGRQPCYDVHEYRQRQLRGVLIQQLNAEGLAHIPGDPIADVGYHRLMEGAYPAVQKAERGVQSGGSASSTIRSPTQHLRMVCTVQLGHIRMLTSPERCMGCYAGLGATHPLARPACAVVFGARDCWLVLSAEGSTVLLLSTQAKPTADQQARACACTCASCKTDLILQCMAQHTAVQAVQGGEHACQGSQAPHKLFGRHTAFWPNLKQALYDRKTPPTGTCAANLMSTDPCDH